MEEGRSQKAWYPEVSNIAGEAGSFLVADALPGSSTGYRDDLPDQIDTSRRGCKRSPWRVPISTTAITDDIRQSIV